MAYRPEMFGHTGGFSGMADSMEPCKMLWDRPCCHGNEIWARRGDPVACRLVKQLLFGLVDNIPFTIAYYGPAGNYSDHQFFHNETVEHRLETWKPSVRRGEGTQSPASSCRVWWPWWWIIQNNKRRCVKTLSSTICSRQLSVTNIFVQCSKHRSTHHVTHSTKGEQQIDILSTWWWMWLLFLLLWSSIIIIALCPIHTADADETKLSSRVASAVWTQPSAVVTQFTISCADNWQVTT